jgi:hypothetical protein
MAKRLPEPVTKNAILRNARGEWTPHVYTRSRVVQGTSGQPVGVEFLFKCEHTGAERRWGLEPAPGAEKASA